MPSNRKNVAPTPIETAGEVFPGGACIELIQNPETAKLLLLFSDVKNCTATDRIEHGGRTYIPLKLDSKTIHAMKLPDEARDFHTTGDLFHAIRQIFADYGFWQNIAAAGTYFVFSSWFPDCTPTAPCLLVSGPKPEADLFFQIMACLVRHQLQLADFNWGNLYSVMKVQPTLLFGENLMSASKLRMLFASNNPQTLVPAEDTLVSFYSAKAIYRGAQFEEGSNDNSILRINLMPVRGRLPILSLQTQLEIARKFQCQLLRYRIQNIEKVRDSVFDFPWLAAGPRILARVLGACIVDSPEIQADLTPIFRRQQQAVCENAWLDKYCIAIEVGLALCHSKPEEFFAFVGNFTDDVNTILKARGNNELLEPREMGSILRSLGLYPKRRTKGFAIRMTIEIRRMIHRLALEFDVAALMDEKPRCPHCHDVIKSDIAGASPATGSDDLPEP
jgi:hypothetical protein